MLKVLFVGNFLSAQTGTKSVSETIINSLSIENYNCLKCSHVKNQFLRLLDFIWQSLTRSYDLVHIDTYSGLSFISTEFVSFISKFRGKKIILTLHGGNLPVFYEANKSRVHIVFKRANYIQTPSLSLQQFFLSHGIKINYLPNPIDFKNFTYNREKIISKSLLWVRAFTNIYNPELAIMTLFELRKTHANATLTMIGPDKGTLFKIENLINSLGLNSVVYIIGPVNNKLLYKYYQTHEVFLNTTSIESFGVAVVEAASCGIPIVSTPVGELPLLWKDEKNILFASDPKSFVAQILRLFSSEDLKLKLSENARARIEEFDLIKIIKDWYLILSL
jgi:glycosyltransferase involved in cell wall biosynthesis